MDKILEFLDFSSVDPQMYWRITSPDGLRTFEINWRRDHTVHWRFREFGTLFWTLCEANTLLGRLGEAGADLEKFEVSLKMSLLHQVCFADSIVKDSRRLLGDDVVDRGIEEHRDFLINIEEVATRLLKIEESPKLRIVKD